MHRKWEGVHRGPNLNFAPGPLEGQMRPGSNSLHIISPADEVVGKYVQTGV